MFAPARIRDARPPRLAASRRIRGLAAASSPRNRISDFAANDTRRLRRFVPPRGRARSRLPQ